MKLQRIIAALGAATLVAGAAQAQSDQPRANPVARLAGNLQAGPNAPSLRSLLAANYEIIHVDAPAGGLTARFILQKNDKVYSCAPTVPPTGSFSAQPSAIETPCIDLTP